MLNTSKDKLKLLLEQRENSIEDNAAQNLM